uniref:Uncharacterized protein n=1 Tax=Macrostomum lignano TaxID=282301 RepID=A0A1I8JLW6_9PLAT
MIEFSILRFPRAVACGRWAASSREMLLGKPLFPGSSTLNQMRASIMVGHPSPSQEDIRPALAAPTAPASWRRRQSVRRRSLEIVLVRERRPGCYGPDAAPAAVQPGQTADGREAPAAESLCARFHNPPEEIALRPNVVPR